MNCILISPFDVPLTSQ